MFDYFHGNPNKDKMFLESYNNLFKFSQRFHRIRVTHNEIFELLNKDQLFGKVYKIPLGISIKNFNECDLEKKIF